MNQLDIDVANMDCVENSDDEREITIIDDDHDDDDDDYDNIDDDDDDGDTNKNVNDHDYINDHEYERDEVINIEDDGEKDDYTITNGNDGERKINGSCKTSVDDENNDTISITSVIEEDSIETKSEQTSEPEWFWYSVKCIDFHIDNVHTFLNFKIVKAFRNVLYLRYNPFRHVSAIIDFDKRPKPQPKTIKTGAYTRTDVLKEIEKFINDMLDSNSPILRDAPFIFSLFTYILAVGYTEENYSIPFVRYLNAYIEEFGVKGDYDGYFLSNESSCGKLNHDTCRDDISSMVLESRQKRSIKALYNHPKYPNYFVFLTCYKFLNQWKNARVNLPTTITAENNWFRVQLNSDDAFVRQMESLTHAFVSKIWTDENILLLNDNLQKIKSPIMTQLKKINLLKNFKTMKYITGTACCGKTSMLKKLHKYQKWCAPSRGSLGGFGGKCNSPALIASMHASTEYALSHFTNCVVGDRGPLDNYLWTFIMPILENVSNLSDDKEITTMIFHSFLKFLNNTQNEFSLAYYANHDVLIIVDPLYEKVHKRMIDRASDNDLHRAQIPYYSLVQNIVYTIIGCVFEYRIISMPYKNDISNNFRMTKIEEDYEKFDDIQDDIIKDVYGSAGSAVEFERVLNASTKITKNDVPLILKSTAYQHIIGIHK